MCLAGLRLLACQYTYTQLQATRMLCSLQPYRLSANANAASACHQICQQRCAMPLKSGALTVTAHQRQYVHDTDDIDERSIVIVSLARQVAIHCPMASVCDLLPLP